MLVIWDVKTGIPRKTIFDPHPLGTSYSTIFLSLPIVSIYRFFSFFA